MDLINSLKVLGINTKETMEDFIAFFFSQSSPVVNLYFPPPTKALENWTD